MSKYSNVEYLRTEGIHYFDKPFALKVNGSRFFWTSKRTFDIAMSVALLPVLLAVSLALIFLNPKLNRGALLFRQERLGRDLKPFTVLKFRTMRPVARILRNANDPVEQDRITPLGRFLRLSRIDELPQILNVLKGDMSLIGPRPDYIEHAKVYMQILPKYALRHQVRPGISGLAQVTIGYVSTFEDTSRKVDMDCLYIESASFNLEMKIFVKTLLTVIGLRGN